ncbi:unnamed protein product [Peronospora belbahrii]|uniref:Uncharacterized protein n=1 Tax=Peronospora belbahrii TaxID=622444 RepID=A0AAU9LFE8_9STRA|nr:unnamed protein product [Peronospora belbahrii]
MIRFFHPYWPKTSERSACLHWASRRRAAAQGWEHAVALQLGDFRCLSSEGHQALDDCVRALSCVLRILIS